MRIRPRIGEGEGLDIRKETPGARGGGCLKLACLPNGEGKQGGIHRLASRAIQRTIPSFRGHRYPVSYWQVEYETYFFCRRLESGNKYNCDIKEKARAYVRFSSQLLNELRDNTTLPHKEDRENTQAFPNLSL